LAESGCLILIAMKRSRLNSSFSRSRCSVGAWGAGLYPNDSGCSVRDSLVMHLKHGKSGREAAQTALDDYDQLLNNHKVECLVSVSFLDSA
jgi:hypothetical protein